MKTFKFCDSFSVPKSFTVTQRYRAKKKVAVVSLFAHHKFVRKKIIEPSAVRLE
mgnify:CR=1 FL=1